jgi:hypothetical protein
MRDGRALGELKIELGILLILVSGPEAVIRQRVVPGLVSRRRLPTQAFGVHARDRARAHLGMQLPPIDEPQIGWPRRRASSISTSD